ncbi:hypothetical protein P9112_004168 [Eukaryota sp. TZLM1-RC]
MTATELPDVPMEPPKADIRQLLQEHSQIEAADVALETKEFDLLFNNVDDSSLPMLIQYITTAAQYFIPTETVDILRYVARVQLRKNMVADALLTALSINDEELAKEVISHAQTDSGTSLQVSWILDRCGCFSLVPPSSYTPDSIFDLFMDSVKSLEMQEPKDTESIYKSRLSESMYLSSTRATSSTAGRRVDSAAVNLANTYTNAFVHAGYGQDSVYTDTNAYINWTSRQKARGVTAAAAGLGLVHLFQPNEGANVIDPILNSSDPQAIAGGLLGIAICHSSFPDEGDVVVALLEDGLSGEKGPECQVMSCLGLGIAYVGTNRDDIAEALTSGLLSGSAELSCVCALALGMIFVGSGNDDVSQLIVSTFFERIDSESHLCKDSVLGLMILGLSMVFLAKEHEASELLLTLENAIEENGDNDEIKKSKKKVIQSAHILVSAMSQVNNGNVLAVQHLLSIISSTAAEYAVEQEKEEKDKENKAKKQSFTGVNPASMAVICIALIAGTEDVGNEMALKLLTSINQFSVLEAKQAVPAALALMSWSMPRTFVTDSLIRLAHDTNSSVAASAILALGLTGQGTNNTRIAQNLRRLVDHYEKDSTLVLACRIAQGLLHTGKGLVAAVPYVFEGKVVSKRAFAGILPVLISLLDPQNFLLSKFHVLLYCMAPALKPRTLNTIDHEGKKLLISTRVGRAVDTSAMPGKPLRVTGFQTHETPVVVSRGDRGDFGDLSWKPRVSVLEGVVVVDRQ